MKKAELAGELATRTIELERKNRELDIEAALEKVRAKTMAMQRSGELSSVATVLFQQSKELGENPDQISIGIMDEPEEVMEIWISTMDSLQYPLYMATVHEPIVMQHVYRAWKEQKKSLVIDIRGDDLENYNRFRNSLQGPGFSNEGTGSRRVINVAFFSQGTISLSSPEPRPPETIRLLERFAMVFEQAYTRFLDLQKAELRAREAQVEACLERVRAKTMAMRNSSDLLDVLTILGDQFELLGFNFHSANFNTSYRDKDWNLWLYNPGTPVYPEQIHIPYIDHPFFNRTLEALAKGSDFNAFVFTKEEKDGFLDHIYANTLAKSAPEARKKYSYAAPGFAWSTVYLKNTALTIANYDAQPYTEEQNKILRRFGSVFEQSYTRFMDLQKAEAQAREANIEARLERVRSRAMAMQRAEELAALIGTLFTELTKLDLALTRCAIWIFDVQTNGATWWMANSEDPQNPINCDLPYNTFEPYLAFLEQWKKREIKFQYKLRGTIKEDWDEYLLSKTGLSRLPAIVIEGMKAPDTVFLTASFNNFGAMNAATPGPLSDDHLDILLRFAKVFDLGYTRFNDLKQAEAQAREAEIQLALERVRARTMAMQKQNDLPGVLDLLVEQLVKLGVQLEVANFSNNIPDVDWDLWIEVITIDGSIYNNYVHFPRIDHPYFNHVEKNIEIFKSVGTDLFKDVFSKDEKDSWQDYIYSQTIYKDIVPQEHKQIMYDKPGYAWSMVILKDTWVSIAKFKPTPFSEEEDGLLRRFATAFGLAFTRFRDFQKAEEQTREAQIEAALERVRSRTMAMFKSDELADAAAVVFKQLIGLGIEPNRLYIAIIKDESGNSEFWITDEDGSKVSKAFAFNLNDNPTFKKMYEGWKEKTKSIFIDIRGKELQEYFEFLTSMDVPFKGGLSQKRREQYISYFSKGFIGMASPDEQSQATTQLLERFAAVFNLTYTRFNDLQRAEAQAREAQIEAALERVRSKAMAMHSSEDVTSATVIMFTELENLGIENFRCGINHILPDRTQKVWSVTNSANGKTLRSTGSFPIDAHPFWKSMYEAWLDKKEYLYDLLAGPEKDDYVKILNATPNYLSSPIKDFPDVHFQIYYFGEGSVWAMTLSRPHSAAEQQIMKRFAAVFSLTFRRYQDLQKAEAQAREATVEAALEKVRGKAMAMHNSNDLSVSASTVFTELRKLGINPIRCGVGLLNRESRKAQLYSAAPGERGDTLSLVGWVLLEKHPVLEKIYGSWLEQYDYFPELQGEELNAYYKLLLAGLPVRIPEISGNEKEFGHFFPFSVGCLYAWSDKRYNEAETKIIKRFAAIIDLTFRRYMELQKSEAIAKEAVKQAALDRVRADIASMRTVADLDRITPLIWNELTILGIPFLRCGVFIMDNPNGLIHTFLSTPDGKAIAAFHIPYDSPGNIRQVLDSWKRNENYLDHWDEPAFAEFAATLVRQGALASPEQYLKSLPRGGIYLHFLPFLQGMLYVGNTTRLSEEAINLIQSVADAFSTAYARYEDFNKLEAAKQQVEKTLIDLKQAQQQLVQSEKMASLGELTAGIAHEIQNPLNFVNNFSDVSNELLDEMKDEILKGNLAQVVILAGDVQQNLGKIAFHGKRADSIVKGMLQHSRTSSGKTELTDISLLCDEYIRLAYHGLRARDKSFNAKFETRFDSNIGKVNVMPQEMGRVILNLISNAFYTVNEKARQNIEGFEPTVIVSTKKEDGKVLISVSDNGSGVPQKVLDKIFQPFFTTKPAGMGTGLGLSLSYDIVKSHGGEIKVETAQGSGSNFVIVLPAASQDS